MDCGTNTIATHSSPAIWTTDASQSCAGLTRTMSWRSPMKKTTYRVHPVMPIRLRVIRKIMIEPRVRACAERVRRGQEQGRSRKDVDVDDVVEMLYAPLYYRLLLHTRPVTPDQVTGILDMAFTGLAPSDHVGTGAQPRAHGAARTENSSFISSTTNRGSSGSGPPRRGLSSRRRH